MYPKDATTAVHLLDLFPGAHVLEAGTGNGSMTLYIQRAIQGRGSHLDTVDIKNEHSQQAEQNVERFWRGMYRPGITFWRSVGGLQKVIKHLKGEDQEDTTTSPSEFTPTKSGEDAEPGVAREGNKLVSPLDRRRAEFLQAREVLPPNPHPMGHQYDAIALDLPDCKSVLLDLSPLLKPDRPMCLYMVNMSQVLETVQWMRTHCNKYTVERVLEVEWKEWSVRSAAVRSRVRGRVNVGGQGQISHLQRSGGIADGRTLETLTTASDNIPDDAVGWICRPLHIPIGHTGFLVQLRKNLTEDF
jgi:tRNA A58 N-methylase Trm61